MNLDDIVATVNEVQRTAATLNQLTAELNAIADTYFGQGIRLNEGRWIDEGKRYAMAAALTNAAAREALTGAALILEGRDNGTEKRPG